MKLARRTLFGGVASLLLGRLVGEEKLEQIYRIKAELKGFTVWGRVLVEVEVKQVQAYVGKMYGL